jgi:hypothetical protein
MLVFVVIQMVVSASGRLAGGSGEDQLPTILVVAHYDAGGGAPGLAAGADSNGSGVAMLLELARLFAPLYSSSRNATFMELKGSLSSMLPASFSRMIRIRIRESIPLTNGSGS